MKLLKIGRPALSREARTCEIHKIIDVDNGNKQDTHVFPAIKDRQACVKDVTCGPTIPLLLLCETMGGNRRFWPQRVRTAARTLIHVHTFRLPERPTTHNVDDGISPVVSSMFVVVLPPRSRG